MSFHEENWCFDCHTLGANFGDENLCLGGGHVPQVPSNPMCSLDVDLFVLLEKCKVDALLCR